MRLRVLFICLIAFGIRGGAVSAQAKHERSQVAMEIRVLFATDNAVADVSEKLGVQWKDSDGITHAVLTDMNLMNLIRTLQNDRATHITQLPKLTLFDGQDAKVEVGCDEAFRTGIDFREKDGKTIPVAKSEKIYLGTRTRLSASISADRRYVSVNADLLSRGLIGNGTPLVTVAVPLPGVFDKPEVSQVEVERPSFEEIKFAAIATIRDQRTIAFIAGKGLADESIEPRTSPLSRIPYLSRLARTNYVRATKTVIFMITPRIIDEQETVVVERPRANPQPEDDGKFPRIVR